MIASSAGGFDRVERVLPSGQAQQLTRREFEALPLSERVRGILRKELRFFLNGKQVSPREALGGND